VTTQTLQNDPDVKLPKSVLEAAARAEGFYKNASTGEPASTPEEVTPQGNPDLDPAALAATDIDVSQAPDPVTKEPEKPAAGEESWEHKYKSIHGRYVRSQEQVRELSERVSNLQNMLASMQATTAAAPAQIPELSAERLITPEEANDYGEDFIKVVGKKAREELAPVINAYQAEISKLKQQLEGVQGVFRQDSHQKLLGTLDEKLPNWRDLNTNEGFLDWLRLPDPYSGAIRHDMLKAAYAQGDAHRVLAFFNGFLAEEAAVAPAGAEPDQSVTRVPKVPLANLAAPGRAKTAASSTGPAEKPIFTRAQIAAFYADVAAGKFRGRDADKSKTEAMIFEAQREGRIR
jgi:prefoldin subunit 5